MLYTLNHALYVFTRSVPPSPRQKHKAAERHPHSHPHSQGQGSPEWFSLETSLVSRDSCRREYSDCNDFGTLDGNTSRKIGQEMELHSEIAQYRSVRKISRWSMRLI